MTRNLPAIRDSEIEQIEAAMLVYAKQCVRFIHNDSLRLTGYSWFSRAGGHMLTRRVMKQYAMRDPFTLDEIISDAIAGWPDAIDALDEIITTFHALGHKLPPQLAAYDIHMRRIRHPAGIGRRQKADHISRNIA